MKKTYRRLTAVITAAVLSLTFTAADLSAEKAYTANAEEPEAVTWEHSKSKEAENLNADYISDITLSLPSAEEQLSSEVCFVLDKSQFSDTEGPALQLLSDLKTAAENSSASVKVDVIGFNRTAFTYGSGSFDLSTQYEDIVQAFQQDMHGGTNMHAGLLKAEEVLAADASIPDSRKYMILVSDGDTYLYCPDGDYRTPYSRAYTPAASAGATAYGGYYDESRYSPSAGYTDPDTGVTNVTRPSAGDPAEWEAYLEDVRARNEESDGDSYDFVWYYYDHNWADLTADQAADDGYRNQPCVPRSASNIDMAFLYAAEVYHTLAEKYHCYAMAVPSWNTADGGHEAFMDWLNNGAANGFADIEKEILYYLGAGSTVEDYMGYTEDDNFDLYDPEAMTVRVENTDGSAVQTYPAVKIANNHYGFGPLGDGSYSYEVTYVPGESSEEHLLWKTNVNITSFMRVSLRYQAKLMNPKTVPGTYGTYDRDGSQHTDGLYTNNRAVLHPVASDGTIEAEEEFSRPTVSYTVTDHTTAAPSEKPSPAVSDPPVKKVIAGDTPETDSAFTFVLAAEDSSSPMPSGSSRGTKTVTFAGAGSYEFGNITFTEPGTYVYHIREEDTGAEGYTCDTSVCTLTYTVTEDKENNRLVCERTVTKDGTETDAIVFVNTYTAEEVPFANGSEEENNPTVSAESPAEHSTASVTPDTGVHDTGIYTWAYVLCGSLAAVYLQRKKENS